MPLNPKVWFMQKGKRKKKRKKGKKRKRKSEKEKLKTTEKFSSTLKPSKIVE